MQLPIAGHPLHTRSLTVVATVQDDGRWCARGDVIDLRKCSFVPMLSDIQPAGIVHMMSIEARFDPATRVLDELVVDQPFVAVEPSTATRGECCRDPAPRLQALVGERLDASFAKRLSEIFGGPLGCSHLLTLFQLMGSALPRALDFEASLEAGGSTSRTPNEKPFRRSVFIDGHEAEDGSIDVGVQLSDFHTLPSVQVRQPLQRLAREYDARALARVETKRHQIHEIAAAIRERGADDLGTASWYDRSDGLGSLVDAPMIGGLARRVFAIAAEQNLEPWLLDSLLQLAPGYIQVMAAISERWFTEVPAGSAGSTGANQPSRTPGSPVGGRPDSCYLWRSDGAALGARSGR